MCHHESPAYSFSVCAKACYHHSYSFPCPSYMQAVDPAMRPILGNLNLCQTFSHVPYIVHEIIHTLVRWGGHPSCTH